MPNDHFKFLSMEKQPEVSVIQMKPHRLFILFFVICFLWSTSLECHAKELRIAVSYDIPPYVTENGTKGLQLEIFQKAMEDSGYSFSILQAPFRRLEMAITEMGMDGFLSLGTTNVVNKAYDSNELLRFKNYAITKKGAGIILNSIADLKGHHILSWQQAHKNLGPEFEKTFGPATNTLRYSTKYHEIPLQKNQVDMFLRGRADVIIINQHIFEEFVNQLSDIKALQDCFVYHDIFSEVNAFKVSFKEKDIRDAFNSGLQQIQNNGIYQALVEQYSTSSSPLITTADLGSSRQ